MTKKKKKPVHKEKLKQEKNVRGGSKADSIISLPVAWHVRTIDKGGPWGWNKADAKVLLNEIIPRLSMLETMTWPEILGRRNHEVEVSGICPEARKRLAEIMYDDVSILVSFRLDGLKRVWGIRDRNICKLLWWDPEHTVYPTKKKHT